MTHAKTPQRLDPQDILKLLVALRRALKGDAQGFESEPKKTPTLSLAVGV
ncbi:hypothetical protein ACQKP5_21940 [Pseudomonas vancouverensis]